MNKLAMCYHDSEGIEKNLEKAFCLYQKAAEVVENGDKRPDNAMNSLALCYSKGKGTEKNLEKAFYWYQKAVENGEINNELLKLNNKCKECEQPYIYYQWCQQCN